MLRVAGREEQAQHTDCEDDGDCGDEPHRMRRQPHDHEEGDGRQRNQHPAGHTEPLADGMGCLEHLRILVIRIGVQHVFRFRDRTGTRLPWPIGAVLQTT